MRFTRGILPASALLLALAHAPASAFTFVLGAGSTDQHMTWFWERDGINCWSTPTNPCGDVYSANGVIPWSGTNGAGIVTGGSLNWTSSSGSLKVVALPTDASRNNGLWGLMGSWTAIDAQAPVGFMLIPEAGEPVPLTVSLLVRPRVVGTLEQVSHAGTTAYMNLQLMYAVSVNGVQVTRDSLYGEFTQSDGASAVWSAAFPKGTANNVVVPNVTNGSLILVTMWIYMRTIAYGNATSGAYGAYGDGPAVEIQFSNANAVAVDDPDTSLPLSLAASPNPSSGSARIAYSLPRAAPVRLTLYDIAGHRVDAPVDGFQEAGRHDVAWDGRRANGERLSAGIYLMELVAGAERRVGKLVITR